MAILGPIGTPELIIILLVLLLIFGARRLPEMGRSLGRGMREFKDAVTGVEDAVATTTTTPTPPAELPATVSEPRNTAKPADDAPAENAERETVS